MRWEWVTGWTTPNPGRIRNGRYIRSPVAGDALTTERRFYERKAMKWLVRYSQSVVPVSIFFSPFLAVPLLEIPFGRSAILYASACLVSVIGSVGSAGAMAFLIYGNGTSIVPSRYRTLRNAWKEAVDW